MNFRDLLMPFALALVTTWGIHHFFFSSTVTDESEVRSGQSFKAPKTKQELKPINTEIDFIDVKRLKPAQVSEIETDGARLVFTTDGASLESLEFKHVYNCPGCPIKTIESPAETQKEGRAFLVGLGHDTPYYYELFDRVEIVNAVQLVYRAHFQDGMIEKKYVVYKDSYKIDLDIKLEFNKAESATFEPRVFFTSPVVKLIEEKDAVSAILFNEKGSLDKITRSNIDVEKGWFAPTFFGTDDRYFVHALVADQKSFAQRAYFKLIDKNKIVSIIEGPTVGSIAGAYQWSLSFYFGPKEVVAFDKVDHRLEQTLDYSGFFAPVSKFLLYILKLLFSYLKNYGLAIIVLTILVKLVLLPFTFGVEDGMQKRAEFDKKLKYIQQKHKHEPDVLAHERAELIKKHGMPGLSGCLPMLLQLPIFIALSRVLSSAIELYNAPFVAWIHDLSASDPYYVLPIITAVAMMIQTTMTSTTNDPKQRMAAFIMPLIIGAFTANLAAGLSLYICTFTILGVVQTKILKIFKRS